MSPVRAQGPPGARQPVGRPNPALPFGWLGYVEVTANQAGITAETDLPGLSVTVVVGVARRIRVTGFGFTTRTVADGYSSGYIREGVTGLGQWAYDNRLESGPQSHSVILTPTAGVHTYKLTLARTGGTGTTALVAGAGYAASLLVEDIGPA